MAFLEQDIQKALLHLVTIERRLQKLEDRVNTLAKGQAEIAARPAPEPTAQGRRPGHRAPGNAPAHGPGGQGDSGAKARATAKADL